MACPASIRPRPCELLKEQATSSRACFSIRRSQSFSDDSLRSPFPSLSPQSKSGMARLEHRRLSYTLSVLQKHQKRLSKSKHGGSFVSTSSVDQKSTSNHPDTPYGRFPKPDKLFLGNSFSTVPTPPSTPLEQQKPQEEGIKGSLHFALPSGLFAVPGLVKKRLDGVWRWPGIMSLKGVPI